MYNEYCYTFGSANQTLTNGLNDLSGVHADKLGIQGKKVKWDGNLEVYPWLKFVLDIIILESLA